MDFKIMCVMGLTPESPATRFDKKPYKEFDPAQKPEFIEVLRDQCTHTAVCPDTKQLEQAAVMVYCDLILVLFQGLNLVPYEVKAYLSGHDDIKHDRLRDNHRLEQVREVQAF